MKLKLFESNKLHYGKYLYKLSINNKLASIFRTEFQKDGGLNYARRKLDECNLIYKQARKENDYAFCIPSPWRFNDTFHVEDYYDAIKIYKTLKKSNDYKIRVESQQLFLYSNDKAFLKKLINICDGCGNFWEPPVDSIEKMLQDKNVIISEKPVEYKYKITFGKREGSPALVSWIDANPKLAKISPTVRALCLMKSPHVKGSYFYIKDDRTLFIIEMIIGDNIQRIDKFVYRYQ